MTISTEIDNNYNKFYADWTDQCPKNWSALGKQKCFLESYRRLCCLGALKRDIVVPHISTGSAAFMLEAHNDALTSHVMANIGAWRVALQALRSCIENSLCCLYYKDHPVELELWTQKKFRITFSDLHKYFASHPGLRGISNSANGLDQIHEEYATLSLAVHGSNINFRMTDSISEVLLWDSTPFRTGKWATRERKVLEGVALLIGYLFRAQLEGARQPQVRALMAYVVGPSKRGPLKSTAKIHI